jgi:cyclic dehypoxanthinyl futalosine synthase
LNINRKEALKLFRNADLLELAKLAEKVKSKIHKNSKRVTFVVDRNINYTNICKCKCKFCAFYKDKDSKEAYVLTKEEIFKKIEETLQYNGTQILIQGGLNPDLKIEFFENLFSEIKKRYQINIHGLSAPEIYHIAENSRLSIEETLTRLKNAGLGSIPGGGAEILVDRVRNIISPNKISWEKWANVMLKAHSLGIKSTATMMFGSIEKEEDIIEHIFRIKEIQDKTGGFTAFICWTFQPQNTELEKEIAFKATGVDFLRVLAISRIILTNIKNIQTSWVTQGSKIAQVSLFFGANDFGSTMLEENVVSAAGVKFNLSIKDIIYLIKDAGFIPAQRDTFYNIIKEY